VLVSGSLSEASTLTTYINVFSQPFMLSVLFSLLASAVLTLPIAAWLYHRHGGIRFGAVISIYLCILYIFALAFFTLYPLPADPAQFCRTHSVQPNTNFFEFVNDFRKSPLSAFLQLSLNVIFFIPLGFILRRLAHWHGWAVVLSGFAVSLFIETAQLTGMFHLVPCSYREFDVDDLATNTLGALIGLLLAYWWDRVHPQKTHTAQLTANPGFIRRLVAFILDWLLIALSAYMAVALLSLLVSWIGRWQAGTALSSGTALRRTLDQIFLLIAFAIGEILIPACRHGRTLMGGYVNMTVETRQRSGKMRCLFYVLRFAVLLLVVAPRFVPSGAPSRVNSVVSMISMLTTVTLAIYWIIRRRMPYDELPGLPQPQDLPSPVSQTSSSSSAQPSSL
jgi:glycopeptide antibiotics resistance protein/uncharacterized membrane protein